jgi:hypothetical protein
VHEEGRSRLAQIELMADWRASTKLLPMTNFMASIFQYKIAHAAEVRLPQRKLSPQSAIRGYLALERAAAADPSSLQHGRAGLRRH